MRPVTFHLRLDVDTAVVLPLATCTLDVSDTKELVLQNPIFFYRGVLHVFFREEFSGSLLGGSHGGESAVHDRARLD